MNKLRELFRWLLNTTFNFGHLKFGHKLNQTVLTRVTKRIWGRIMNLTNGITASAIAEYCCVPQKGGRLDENEEKRSRVQPFSPTPCLSTQKIKPSLYLHDDLAAEFVRYISLSCKKILIVS